MKKKRTEKKYRMVNDETLYSKDGGFFINMDVKKFKKLVKEIK
jgi:hypothetical protein